MNESPFEEIRGASRARREKLRLSLPGVPPTAGELRAALGLYEAAGGRVDGWRGARDGYLLLADYMAPARVAVIAEMLVKVTREHRPLDELMRIALARSREVNPACA